MGKKESSDELIVVDAERYKKVKKALESSKAGEHSGAPAKLDEKESTRELVVVDVKRYKIIKKALAESEERYRQLFENVPIGIYRTTPEGHIVDANPALVKMLGFDSFADLAIRNLENKESFEPGYERAAFVRRLERDGEIKGLEAGWKRKDGTLIHVRENAKLTRGEEGQAYFEGTVEDITQSKLAEETQRTRTQQMEILNAIISAGNLAESMAGMLEKTLENVVEPLGFDTAGIYMYDPEAKKVKLMARRGAPSEFYLLDEYMAIENMPFSQVLLQGQPVFADNLRDAQPDLAEKWGWRMACVIPLVSKGRVIGALGLASCRRAVFSPEEKIILGLIGKEAGTLISKLQTETALRESEKYYRTLIDTSPDIIVAMDLEARVVTVNQQFLKTGGYFYDEVIGKSIYDFVAGLDRSFLEKKTARFIENNIVSGSEYQFRKKDGQAIPLEVSASVLLDNAGHPAGIIAIGRDITERRRSELAIEEKNKVLATLNEISLELAAMPPAADINDYIAKKLMSISRAVYVGVNHYNKDTRQLEFAKANTASHLLNEVNRILGRNVGSIKYDISEAMYKEITGEVVGYRRTLHEVSFGAIGKKAGAVIQRLFSIDHFIGMALVVENELIGTAIMAIGKDTPAVSQELLRSFSHVASVTLRRRQAESQLLAYQEQLRALTLDLTLVEERERRRIAAELHDQIGQNLALCKLKVAALEKGLSREKVKSELSALRRLLEVSIQGARSLVFDLSPPVLYELGFQAALEWLAEWIGEQYQIPVEFESRGAGEFLESDRQVILFQVVRELLVNVGKHSQASRAKVILSLAERSLHIQVNDDGRGFDASQIYDAKARKGGFGFFSMRERLNFLGGGIDIKSKPGKGTQIVLTVPQGTPPPAGKKEDA